MVITLLVVSFFFITTGIILARFEERQQIRNRRERLQNRRRRGIKRR